MNQAPRSWAASMLGFALMVLAACAALKLAADLLKSALIVLVPMAIVVLLGLVGWRYWVRSDRW